MTSPRAKAQKLRDQGLTYRQIADRLGVSKQTAYRWLNPDYAESDRRASRSWKDRNREANRARDREYVATHKGECGGCGGPIKRKCDGGMCMACRSGERDRRARQIEAWWADGLTLNQIAVTLGWSPQHVGVEITKLRAKGYSLPYRQKQGTKFPEQVAK